MGKRVVIKHFKKSTVTSFFYNLTTIKKPNVKDTSDSKIIAWAIKYCAGHLYFVSFGIYKDLISKLTRYYPFSLLYQDRLFHAKNLPVRSLMEDIEIVLNKNKIQITVINGFAREPFCVFVGEDVSKKWLTDDGINEIRSTLQSHFPQIYVSSNELKQLEFLIPYEQVFPEN